MDADTFRKLPQDELARWVRANGPQVCVFPINGTRRWFMLEHALNGGDDPLAAYLGAVEQRHIDLYRLFFDHGVHTLLTPAFGPDLLERGDDYLNLSAYGLARVATEPMFLDFYREYGVRVRFYGDYRKYFDPTPHAYLSDLFDDLAQQTLHHDRHRLFIGLFANDPAETVAALAVQYHAEHGRVPDRRALVELYYGEYVAPVDLFVGFDRFAAFDMPLLALGGEDLYFTVSPSPYLTGSQLREIFADHLFTRRADETDYGELSPGDWALMRSFYQANQDYTIGVGARQPRGSYWFPLPQVKLPPGFGPTREDEES
ncbi:MAG: diterpene synthase [Chloroflexi bacterium]|nr:diterpene synthase [Chloroflexota bacterium]